MVLCACGRKAPKVKGIGSGSSVQFSKGRYMIRATKVNAYFEVLSRL